MNKNGMKNMDLQVPNRRRLAIKLQNLRLIKKV